MPICKLPHGMPAIAQARSGRLQCKQRRCIAAATYRLPLGSTAINRPGAGAPAGWPATSHAQRRLRPHNKRHRPGANARHECEANQHQVHITLANKPLE